MLFIATLQLWESADAKVDEYTYATVSLSHGKANVLNDVALMRAVRDHAHEQGYAVSKLRSDKRKIVIKCDRGAYFRSRAASGSIKKRESATRLVDCPFRLTARLQKDSTWILRITVADHNHEPSSDMRGHPTARRLNTSQRTTR
ncbi:hypothetical protein K3495_g2112 [Podosphaera aphanis]|nr:hypothetical protein K3495_g2112 [Podosphaera aphanis]